MKKSQFLFAWLMSVFLALLVPSLNLPSAGERLTLATTTSVQDSGLLDVLVPLFEKKTSCQVRVIAVGTGQAFRLGRDGNADILLVHDRAGEEKFLKDRYGLGRYEVMSNDFIIVGPHLDPAGISGSTNVVTAFERITKTRSLFASRGDDSGTHRKEKEIWESLGVTQAREYRRTRRYLETGAGMEQTLRIANEKLAYCLTDRATWLAHKKELKELESLVPWPGRQGDPLLFNPYSLIPVSHLRHPWINNRLAMKFVEFITGTDGQEIIKTFGEEKYGQPLFFLSERENK